MATVDPTRRPPLVAKIPERVTAVVAVVGLVVLSLLLRATQLHAGFWIDEGISVGVAHHNWTSIPHVLRQDGSPPAYYMLLGLWIRVFGDGEAATHTLSLVFSLASIPVAYLALMVYGHNWALFFCLALAIATVLYVRERLRLFALVAGGVALLYLPWVPTLLSQAKHTGAPWSTRPSFHELFTATGAVLGGDAPFIAFIVAAAVGFSYSRDRIERLLAVLVGGTVLIAWLSSQISPAWTTRYFAVILGPAVLLAAAIVTRAGRVGAVALIAVLFLWWGFGVRNEKENAKQIAAQLAPSIRPGELVVSRAGARAPLLPRRRSSLGDDPGTCLGCAGLRLA